MQRVADIVIEIAEARREQSNGIGQVNRAIVEMDEVTQRNAALVEQAAAATQAMQAEASKLLKTVSVFKLPQDVVAGSSTTAASPALRLPSRATSTNPGLARAA